MQVLILTLSFCRRLSRVSLASLLRCSVATCWAGQTFNVLSGQYLIPTSSEGVQPFTAKTTVLFVYVRKKKKLCLVC